jgi:aerobic C4-dicarboxylate transport protein
VIGLVVVNILQPGVGIANRASAQDLSAVAAYGTQAQQQSTTQFLLNIIPTTVVDAFARGELLQVLLFSVLFGLALLTLRGRVTTLVDLLSQLSAGLFAVIGMIMWLAPIGAFGAMAFTVGQYGIGSLLSLGKLMAGVYITCLCFVFIVLGLIMRTAGLSLWRFLRYIREEILIVLGTSSSESALPRLMVKLEQLGCQKSVVGLVVPTGYSFNLDGTSIYMTMAALFVAQAAGCTFPCASNSQYSVCCC